MDDLRKFGRLGDEKGGMKDRRSIDKLHAASSFGHGCPRDRFSKAEGGFFYLKSDASFINLD
jgi:hypothetical protein